MPQVMTYEDYSVEIILVRKAFKLDIRPQDILQWSKFKQGGNGMRDLMMVLLTDNYHYQDYKKANTPLYSYNTIQCTCGNTITIKS